MTVDKIKEILKHFPDLEEGWKEMEEKLKTEPAEMEMLSLKYRQMLEKERLKENLPEPEFTKAKRSDSDLKVMKAKEAPEKVYLHLTTGNHLLNGKYYEDKPAKIRYDDKIIEYTRTDAFMKKAKEAFCKAMCQGHPPRSTCTSLGTCKEYDNFIKYMKGE